MDWKKYNGFTSRETIKRPIEVILQARHEAAVAEMGGPWASQVPPPPKEVKIEPMRTMRDPLWQTEYMGQFVEAIESGSGRRIKPSDYRLRGDYDWGSIFKIEVGGQILHFDANGVTQWHVTEIAGNSIYAAAGIRLFQFDRCL